MADRYSMLSAEVERARANLCGLAQIAVWFYEAQNHDEAYKSLKSGVDKLNAASRSLFEYQQNCCSEKPSLSQKENTDGNRTAA